MNTLLLVGEPKLWEAPITYLLLAITIFTSYRAIEDPSMKSKLLFDPYRMSRTQEWYRFFSHGLVHADWMHLGFNCFVLYMFGAQVEMSFKFLFGPAVAPLIYLGLYASGLIMASLYSYHKHKENPRYSALGASGAVSSVVFAFVLLQPTTGMGIILISDLTGIFFPAFLFGLLYLSFSAYFSKKGGGTIEHDAHYWGSVWGFVLLTVIKPSLFFDFLTEIKYYLLSFMG